MSKNIHFLIVKRDYLLNPVLWLLHRFWEVLLEQIYQRIDNPDQITLKMGQKFFFTGILLSR